ncbi:MAG: PspC domain-containing protein [Clostridiales bacterium]|nr:PspC domain-containing protein [Clostridiales bacterium]
MKKRLYRSRRDKKLAGVCGGVANYFGIDPIIVRLIWVFLTFSCAVSVLMYIACIFIIPLEEESDMIDGEFRER